jgi:hypothetical protein
MSKSWKFFFSVNAMVTSFGLVVLVVLVLAWFRYRRRYSEYHPGSDAHVMESVSSSMLLSEVDPREFAQVNIVSVIIFQERMRFVDFRDRFVSNFILSDSDSRFLYRFEVSGGFNSTRWVKAKNWHPFDNCLEISQQLDMDSLKALVSRRLSDPLLTSRPVWEMQFIEKLKDDESDPVSAVILTMHHAMGDGFTLCHQLMRRAAPADSAKTMHHCYPFEAKLSTSRPTWFLISKQVIRVMKSVFKLLFLSPDQPSAIRNSVSRSLDDRIVAECYIMSTSVDDLKEIAGKADILFDKMGARNGRVSLNDIIVAATTMALSDLMDPRHDVTSAIWIGLNRKSVIERPNLRRLDWGNENLGTCYLQLPTGESEPLQILKKCHQRMAEMKQSPEPVIANRLLRILGSIPLGIIWPIRNLLMDKMSTSISNFPGPIHRIKLPVAPDGRPNESMDGVGVMRDAFFFVAPPFSYGPYFTILSYAGKMYFAMCVAEKLMKPEAVIEFVRRRIPKAIETLRREIDQLTISQLSK